MSQFITLFLLLIAAIHIPRLLFTLIAYLIARSKVIPHNEDGPQC